MFVLITKTMNLLSGALLFMSLLSLPAISAHARTINFSGLEWEVRDDGIGSPGGNHWRSDNVWLDDQGRLHLRITKIGGVWTCAELRTTRKFLYGRFEFDLIGRPDQFDPNVVLGLFNYPTEAEADGRGEIDIEFSRWGNPTGPAGNFTIWSKKTSGRYTTSTFPLELFGTHTRHVFERGPHRVAFSSYHGHANVSEIAAKTFVDGQVDSTPMPIYINFWLFRAMPPSNGATAEIVISEFRFSE